MGEKARDGASLSPGLPLLAEPLLSKVFKHMCNRAGGGSPVNREWSHLPKPEIKPVQQIASADNRAGKCLISEVLKDF